MIEQICKSLGIEYRAEMDAEWNEVVKPAYVDVPGWFEPSAAVALWLLSRFKMQSNDPIVEIGTYCGRSTAVLVEAKKKVGGLPVITMDNFDGESFPTPRPDLPQWNAERGKIETLAPFRKAWERNRMGDHLVAVMGLSTQLLPFWTRRIGLLFIDATHTYEMVSRDIKDWHGFVRNDGYMTFHDYRDDSFPGVVRAVDEFLTREGEWEKLGVFGTFAVLKRTGCSL